ncbi:MAG: SUMF1/EgtB/PvdO family nonheme iron enzyme [Chitinivibrionales bacterium]|nr:SUMF1/EgtB/PvdO family nonheme iron enzyme [Chitinivibrionales bacterium]
MLRIRLFLFPAIAGIFPLLISCSQIESSEKEWNNPLDPQGTNWYPPSISAMNDTVVAINDSVRLHAQGVDKKEGVIVTYQWSFDKGTNWEFESEANEPFYYSWSTGQTGEHTVYVRAIDNSHLKSETDSFKVMVHSYKPFIISMNDTVASQTASVTFSVSAHDTNGAIEKYYWDIGAEGWDDSTESSSFQLSNPEGGAVEVAWAARDHDNQMALDTFSVLFNRSPQSAGLALPVNSGVNNYRTYDYLSKKGSINLAFEASDPDGASDTLEYVFYLGSSKTNLSKKYSGNTPSVIIDNIEPSSTYYWKLVATDLYGDSAVGTGTFSSPNAPPSPPGMALIPSAGKTFSMGKPKDKSSQLYEHTVSFSHNFWIDSTEVTHKEFMSVMNITDTSAEDIVPVTGINWYDAVLYCNSLSKRNNIDTVYSYTSVNGIPGNNCALEGLKTDLSIPGYRLPTEAEWEFACRGGSSASLYWGASMTTMAEYVWYEENSDGPAHPVALKPANPYGLYDMLGNVWEWCNDWYDFYYYHNSPSTDPEGPDSSVARVVRGASWQNDQSFIAAYTRDKMRPDASGPALGFRTVLYHP